MPHKALYLTQNLILAFSKSESFLVVVSRFVTTVRQIKHTKQNIGTSPRQSLIPIIDVCYEAKALEIIAFDSQSESTSVICSARI